MPVLGLLDVTLILATLFVVALGLRSEKDRRLQRAVFALPVLLVLHLLGAGFRWQYVAAYLALILAFMATKATRRWLRILTFPVAVLLIGVSVLASWAFPLFKVPSPTGAYPVGTTKLFVVDESRQESYTATKSDSRELTLKVWYPSKNPTSGERVSYWEKPLVRSKAVTKGTPLPWFTFTHLGLIKTHSKSDAQIADGKFPVIIYSHGLGIGWSSGNTPLLEDLASRGYIVVAIGHSYIGSATIFPDHVAYFDPATREAMNTKPPENVIEIYGRVKEIRDPKEQLAVYMRSMELMPTSIKGKVDEALHTQVEDQRVVIEMLPELMSENIDFRPHISSAVPGVFGMSIGGSAALISCSAAMRCAAVANMDGFHPDQARLKSPVPLLTLRRPDNLLVEENFAMAMSDAYLVEVSNTTHFDFFDFTIMSPLYRKLGVLGGIDGAEMVAVSRAYVGAFFDRHLKGMNSELLSNNSATPSKSVRLTVRERKQIQ
ncbi:MAG: hypothetical protein AAF662_13670 [Pseudomonadota bacterium]